MSYLPYHGQIPKLTDEQFEMIASISLPLMDRDSWVKARAEEIQRLFDCKDNEISGYDIAYFAMKKERQQSV